MKSGTYARVVCKQKLVGGGDREQRMFRLHSISRKESMYRDLLSNDLC